MYILLEPNRVSSKEGAVTIVCPRNAEFLKFLLQGTQHANGW